MPTTPTGGNSWRVLPASPDPLARLKRAGEQRGVPLEVRRAVFERDSDTCVRCGSADRLGLDHVIPRSKGGKHTISNLRVLCLSCNSAKGNRLDPAFPKPLPEDAAKKLEALRAANLYALECEREYREALFDARKQGASYAELARVL